ncbi:Co2+/Mg2+ efflux protein ApaG [Methylocapsa sp. S129]|uniref:Co2+/Mg2+ efflux protein ApaG n=1 Tax=Methylocapsa sp. S129 TaxID=1641869 RepID=UPI00131AB88E|nr:Co2+/Mg2+ efflux protein ApaG [Methylocapsa sp. S129]
MYTAVSNKIKVTVRPKYLEEQSEPDESRYFWSYTIEIANVGDRIVQLTHRHWEITDANGRREEVRGPGVVGEQPKLKPGDAFSYTSGCPLKTPSGIMVGTYRMIDESGEAFDVAIPAFSLDSPHAKRMLN